MILRLILMIFIYSLYPEYHIVELMQDYNQPRKGLPDDTVILECLEKCLDENLVVAQNWRQLEVQENFALFEGNQWTEEAYNRQIANGMPVITINRVSPVTEAICGFEVQNRMDIKYSPRLIDPEQVGFKDLMNNLAKYFDETSNAAAQHSLAFKDMGLCGVGAISTSISYDQNPNGQVEVRRIFPAFVFWDVAARAKNITDSDTVVEVKILSREAIKAAYGVEDDDEIYPSDIDARVLQFFNSVLTAKELGVIYEYQWRQKEPFYRVENPFLELDTEGMLPDDLRELQMLATQYQDMYNFNPGIDKVFCIREKSELTDLKKIFSFYGIDIKTTTQHTYKYYRAICTGGKVLSKSENFSQQSFSVQFMTGQFSELTQSYYGWMRGCKDPQRMLNQAVSDYVGFLATIPKGGVNIEADAVGDLEAFIATYAKARSVTVFTPGSLSSGKVLPKVTPALPSGILEMIQYADSQIMQVCGVTPELMGMMNSKEMNSSFYSQQIRQGLTTLATYFDAKRSYLHAQGKLYIDCARVLVENAEGMLIKNVIGEGDAPYVRLLKDGIADEYDVAVEEVPTTPDENNSIFITLLELQKNMPNTNILPLALKYSALPADTIKSLEETMQPPPPPQPDPVNTQLLLSEIGYKTASAQKLKAEAEKINVENMYKQSEVVFAPAKQQTDIDYTQAKTFTELRKAHLNQQALIDARLNNLQTIHSMRDMDSMDEAGEMKNMSNMAGMGNMAGMEEKEESPLG